jgi:hypothetical protein
VAVVLGYILTGDGGYGAHFLPVHCRLSYVSPAVPPARGFAACLSCGHLWSVLDPAALLAYIERTGDELAQQQLDELARGPFRDLPDTELAREVGTKIAEVDAMARRGAPAAARKYREVQGVTWDQALHDTKNWHKLSRQEKLELFGWTSKKKTPVDDLDAPFP